MDIEKLIDEAKTTIEGVIRAHAGELVASVDSGLQKSIEQGLRDVADAVSRLTSLVTANQGAITSAPPTTSNALAEAPKSDAPKFNPT